MIIAYNEIIAQELNAIKLDIIKLYDAKGMRASGDFANSLEVLTNENGAELWGNSYAEQLEEGRSAGGFPPINLIEKWIVDKSIQYENITLSSLAFLIARKISREGWDRSQYGGVELISQIVTPERIQRIIDRVGDLQVSGFIEQFKKELAA